MSKITESGNYKRNISSETWGLITEERRNSRKSEKWSGGLRKGSESGERE